MNTRKLAALLALGLLVACDEGVPGDSTDVVEDTDTGSTDTADDTTDTVEDTAGDTAGDTTDTVEDTGTADTVEVGDTADAADVADEEVGPDTGTDCSDDDAICEDPYVCLAGVCRLPIADTTWAESDFDIAEPEELSAIFDTFKSFATSIKFMVLDVGAGTVELTARVGAADILDASAHPIQVSYQEGISIGAIVLRPHVDDEAPLDGDSWLSDPFFYELRATATIEFPTLDPIAAAFGLDANDVTVEVTLPPSDVVGATTAHIVGYVTRSETEYRTMMDRDELPAFGALFCMDDPSWDPGLEWNLSDVLDCNGAEMDVDSDGDTFMDSYRVVIDASLVPAQLIE